MRNERNYMDEVVPCYFYIEHSRNHGLTVSLLSTRDFSSAQCKSSMEPPRPCNFARFARTGAMNTSKLYAPFCATLVCRSEGAGPRALCLGRPTLHHEMLFLIFPAHPFQRSLCLVPGVKATQLVCTSKKGHTAAEHANIDSRYVAHFLQQ